MTQRKVGDTYEQHGVTWEVVEVLPGGYRSVAVFSIPNADRSAEANKARMAVRDLVVLGLAEKVGAGEA